MDFYVYLDSDNRRVNKYVDEVIKIMNAHQSEFRLIDKSGSFENQKICECIGRAANNENQINYEKSRIELNALDFTGKYIIITDKQFDDNWFAHSNTDYWFMSVSDWDKLYAPPHMDKYIQRGIIKFFADCAANLSNSQIRNMCRAHIEATEDCIFDFCKHKTDIKISMRNGRICPACKQKLIEFEVSDEQFQAIDILLKIMTGKANFEKVFIVHGHGEYKDAVARFIKDIGLEPIILSEQPNKGRTIIEKFETYSSKADFAIALYTPDDVGGVSPDKLNPRARQNVVFEHGYFMAKLGRENVVVLLKNDTEKTKLETAGDNDGIIYVPFDEYGGWKDKIKSALKLSGYDVTRAVLAGV